MDNVANISRIGNYFEVTNISCALGLPKRFAVSVEFPAEKIWDKCVRTMWVAGVFPTLIGALRPGLILSAKDIKELPVAEFKCKYNGHAELCITEEDIMTVMVSSMCFVAHGCKAPADKSELFVNPLDDESWTCCAHETGCISMPSIANEESREGEDENDAEAFVSIESEFLPKGVEPCPIPINPDEVCDVQYDEEGNVTRCLVTLSAQLPFEEDKAEMLRRCMNDIALELVKAYEFSCVGLTDQNTLTVVPPEQLDSDFGVFCTVRDENGDILIALQLDSSGAPVVVWFEYNMEDFADDKDYEDFETRHNIAQRIPNILAEYPELFIREDSSETTWLLDDKEADALRGNAADEAVTHGRIRPVPIVIHRDDNDNLVHCEIIISLRNITDAGKPEVQTLLNTFAAIAAKAYNITYILDENGNIKPCAGNGATELHTVKKTENIEVHFAVEPDSTVPLFGLYYDTKNGESDAVTEKLIDELIKIADESGIFNSVNEF